MVIREGQYALALLEGGVATVRGTKICYDGVEVRGDILPGAIPSLIMDVILLAGGFRPVGLTVASVVDP
jgi:hypothetical protein